MAGKNRVWQSDRIAGLVLFSIGLLIMWQASYLRLGTFRSPGPGLFPFIIGLVIGFLSLWLFFTPGDGKADKISLSRRNLRQIAPVYASLLLYFLILEHLGFLICTFLLLSYLSIAIGRQRATRAIFRAVVITVLCYLLFHVVLKASLPQGILSRL